VVVKIIDFKDVVIIMRFMLTSAVISLANTSNNQTELPN
jgi:hypothetical protein